MLSLKLKKVIHLCFGDVCLKQVSLIYFKVFKVVLTGVMNISSAYGGSLIVRQTDRSSSLQCLKGPEDCEEAWSPFFFVY